MEARAGKCCLYVSIDSERLTQIASWKRNISRSATLQVNKSQKKKGYFALQPHTGCDCGSNAKQHMDMSTKSKPSTTQRFPLTSEPKPADSSPNQTALPFRPLAHPLFLCDSQALAFGRASIGVLSVYQSPIPALSGRVVNFLYVVITYGEELLVSATPAVYELLP